MIIKIDTRVNNNLLQDLGQGGVLAAKVSKGIRINNISKMGRQHANLLKFWQKNTNERCCMEFLFWSIGLRNGEDSKPLKKV